MTLSVNQGVPLVIGRRDHRASKDIFALARELSRAAEASEEQGVHAAAPTKTNQNRGFLARFFSHR
jgi:hypothetical protein